MNEPHRPTSVAPRFLVAALLLLPSCAKLTPRQASHDVAVWDFPPEKGAPLSLLLPKAPGGPLRMKRAVETKEHDDVLSAAVTGRNPAFSWELAKPVHANVATVDVDSDADGMLQLFWTNERCPTFTESCSLTADLVRGENALSFALDDADPVRAVRVDPPDRVGVHLDFRTFLLDGEGRMASRWSARDTVPELALRAAGLVLASTRADPGVTVSVRGLVATRVTAVEVTLRGPRGETPQLFWDGPCKNFSEACSVPLTPADAGALTHRAALRGHSKWTGPIDHLRFDPGEAAGDYVIERLALVRDPSD